MMRRRGRMLSSRGDVDARVDGSDAGVDSGETMNEIKDEEIHKLEVNEMMNSRNSRRKWSKINQCRLRISEIGSPEVNRKSRGVVVVWWVMVESKMLII